MKNFSPFILLVLLIAACGGDDVTEVPVNPEPPVEPIKTALELVAESPRTWIYVQEEQMLSRAGTSTGYLASINPNSKNLLVYFEGGGACFNQETCDDNRSHFGLNEGNQYANSLNNDPGTLWIDREASINPYKDWNYIFIPYSTGDVHLGGNQDADIPNGGPDDQKMTGYSNFTIVAEQLLEYFGSQGVDEILVAGSSAGAYGTYLNFTQVANRFPNAKMTAVIDAGPLFFTENVFDDCLANLWDDLFQIQYPADYETIVTNTYSQKAQGIYEYLSKKYPAANFALLSDTEDRVIRYFFGFGKNNCVGSTAQISGQNFYEGLMQIEQNLNQFDNWSVYFVPDDEHTFLGANRFLFTEVNGTNLVQWLELVRAGLAEDVLP